MGRRAKTSPAPVADHKSVTKLGSCPFQKYGPKGENIARPGRRPQVGDHAWVVPISKIWAEGRKHRPPRSPTTSRRPCLGRAHFKNMGRRAKTSPAPVADHKSVTMLGSCPFQKYGPKGENIARPGRRPQVGDHAWVVPISKKWANVTQSSKIIGYGASNHTAFGLRALDHLDENPVSIREV
jgi:hypothetical protein